tara:strand:+ start:4520 stop:4702 length:183 start_codon:yes stop_codon:yes gene_type:complete
MLFLRRTPKTKYSQIIIGEIIRVKITEVNSGAKEVTVGIEAPKNIKIMRSELINALSNNT